MPLNLNNQENESGQLFIYTHLAMMCENWVHRIHKFSDSVSEKLGGYLLRVT